MIPISKKRSNFFSSKNDSIYDFSIIYLDLIDNKLSNVRYNNRKTININNISN